MKIKKIMSVVIIFSCFKIAFASDTLYRYLSSKGVINENEYKEFELKNKNFKSNIFFTLRYNYLDDENQSLTRQRVLYQFKTDFSYKIDDFILNIGFASGDPNIPRSNFENITSNFSNKRINLSVLNIVYGSEDKVKITAGKFKNNIWMSNWVLWDSDINLEGFAIEKKVGKFNFLGDLLILNETANSYKDPYLLAYQSKFSDKNFELSATYYDFHYIKGISSTTFLARPNYKLNTIENGKYKYDYDVLIFDAKKGFKINSSKLELCVSYGLNTAVSKKREIFYSGLNYSIKKFIFGFNYRRYDEDSFLDTYPDIAVFGGAIGIESYRYFGIYNINKNVSLSPYYIYSKTLRKFSIKPEKGFYIDVYLKI